MCPSNGRLGPLSLLSLVTLLLFRCWHGRSRNPPAPLVKELHVHHDMSRYHHRPEVNSTTHLTMLEREADHGSEWDREVEHGKPEVEPDQQIEAAPMSEGERLQMLGYDAVLGRPLGFWSASAMNFCHLSFQWEWIVYIAMYSYNGPLIFVSGRSRLRCMECCITATEVNHGIADDLADHRLPNRGDHQHHHAGSLL